MTHRLKLACAATGLLGTGVPGVLAQPAGLLHWWAAEDTFLDSKGSAHGSNAGTAFADGRVGRCFRFDGNDSISFGDVATLDFGTSDFSVGFWLRAVEPAQANVWQIMGKRGACGCGSFWDIRSASVPKHDGIGFETYQDGSCSSNNGLAHTGFLDGNWHHFLYTRSGSTARLYRDGVEVQAVAFGATANVANNAPFRMGIGACDASDDGTIPLVGDLDEVRVFSRALTASEALCEAMRPDFNTDGVLDAFDYDDFVSAYFDYVNNGAGFPDYNGDGYVDAFDYDDFVSEFFTCVS